MCHIEAVRVLRIGGRQPAEREPALRIGLDREGAEGG